MPPKKAKTSAVVVEQANQLPNDAITKQSLLPMLSLKDLLLSYLPLCKKCFNHAARRVRIFQRDVLQAKLSPTVGASVQGLICALFVATASLPALNYLPKEISAIIADEKNAGILFAVPEFRTYFLRLSGGMYTCLDSFPNNPLKGLLDYITLPHASLPNLMTATARKMIDSDARHWGSSRLSGEFVLLFDRPDGSILVSIDGQHVFLVVGITESLCEVNYQRLHVVTAARYPAYRLHGQLVGGVLSATLLCFQGKIIHDGMTATDITMATPDQLDSALAAYAKAVEGMKVISSLPVRPSLKATKYSPADMLQWQNSQAEDLDILADATYAHTEAHQTWALRTTDRLVGKLAEDCLSVVDITTATAEVLWEYWQLSAAPRAVTMEDCLQVLAYSCERTGCKPQCLQVDKPNLLVPLRCILRSCGIAVVYAIKRSVELHWIHQHDELNIHFAQPVCNFCNTNHGDGSSSKLLLCTGCEYVHYCCKVHQLRDWQAHKLYCAKLKMEVDKNKMQTAD